MKMSFRGKQCKRIFIRSSVQQQDEKVGLHQKKFIKNYVDKKLRKERTGFAARSVLKSAARRKEKEPTADL